MVKKKVSFKSSYLLVANTFLFFPLVHISTESLEEISFNTAKRFTRELGSTVNNFKLKMHIHTYIVFICA